MPRMVCCKKTCSVGSDDFVISSTLSIILRIVWLGGLIAVTLVALVGRDCFPESGRKAIVFTFIFSQLSIQICVLISEALIVIVSSRGHMNDGHPRRHLPHCLRLRALLLLVEICGCVFGCYVAWSSHIQDHIECERANRVSQAIEAYVISVIVVLTITTIAILYFFDPLGLQTPSLLTELNITHDNKDESDNVGIEVKKFSRRRRIREGNSIPADENNTRLYSASSRSYWAKRIRTLCCCVGSHNNRSRVKALEDIVHSMATMFDGVDITLSDFVAALMLVHRDQKKKMKDNEKHNPAAELRNFTYELMDENHTKFYPPNYDKQTTEKEVDFLLPETHLMMNDINHYLKFALGIYGWPIYLYLEPLVGSACLCTHLKCRAINSRSQDFAYDNCCLANTTALELHAHLKDDDVIYVSYENRVCLPPFSLCFDHSHEAVVLSIRGSMSLSDALTDMHLSMEDIPVDDDNYKHLTMKVHSGMYGAAKKVKKKVDERLEKVFTSNKYQNYKLIITGHSLGAGVGAVLAVMYRSQYKNLHCYAFSPPGSLFTLPLVEYSKSFITSVVYGNDIVPRLTFRGLLYLKKKMTHLFRHCKLPKHAVLCPSLFSCCYQKYWDHHHHQEFNYDPNDNSAEQGLLKTFIQVSSTHNQLAKKYLKIWHKKTDFHQFMEKMYTAEQTPAFVPGRVLHIKDTEGRVHRRFWNILGEKKVSAVWKPNEDFCHIIVDDNMFDDHLPDYVTSAIDRLYNQHVTGNDKLQRRPLAHTDSSTIQKNTITGLPEEIVLPMVDIELDSQHEHTLKSHGTEDELIGYNQQQVEGILTNGQTVVTVHENECTETSA